MGYNKMKRLHLVAGHGSGDPGAVGNGYQEAEVARKIVAALKTKIGGALNVAVYDTSKDLYKSKEYSAFSTNDEVLEVHFNSSSDASANGTEVLIKTGFTPDALDNALLDAMNDYFTNRGIKYRSDLANMNNFASRGISYRLIEVCFITNANDMAILMNNFNAFITNMANKIIIAMGSAGVASSTNEDNDVSAAEVSDGSYKVKVTADTLNIRKGPGTNYGIAGQIKDKGVYTIVQTLGIWGKLKSGAGWISLNYTKKV